MSGHIVKITLENTYPSVWRRVILPEHISFFHLHQVIQEIFGWEDARLHAFSFSRRDALLYHNDCREIQIQNGLRKAHVQEPLQAGLV